VENAKLFIQAAKNGDIEAFNQLVLAYQDKVYTQAFYLLGDPQEAEDITQEAFTKAYQHIASLREGGFLSWVIKIATNACYDELRCRKRKAFVSFTNESRCGKEMDYLDMLPDPSANVEHLLETKEQNRLINDALASLLEEHKAVLVLIDLLELKYVEAARVLGIPVGTVKSRLARARLQMRGRLLRNQRFLPYRSLNQLQNTFA
jgi:RNA polymerase sigma-70 factor (ECF subfamily)